jgi:hypothetical protein
MAQSTAKRRHLRSGKKGCVMREQSDRPKQRPKVCSPRQWCRLPGFEECPIFRLSQFAVAVQGVFPVLFPLCSIRKLLNCRGIPSVPTVPGLPVLNNQLQLYIARKPKPGTIGTNCVSKCFRRIKLGADREPSGNNRSLLLAIPPFQPRALTLPIPLPSQRLQTTGNAVLICLGP